MAFSGGKDSQVVYHLAKETGVDFKAFWSPTTVDPPEVVRFIKTHYPDVEITKPKDSIYNLTVQRYKILPTMLRRWCCAEYKEGKNKNTVVLTGVRKAESVKRAKRKELEVTNHKYSSDFSLYDNSEDAKQVIDRCLGKGKEGIVVNPIIDFTDDDVWRYLNSNNIEHCELYDKGRTRVGCILCPMSTVKNRVRDCKEYPYAKKKWIEACNSLLEQQNTHGFKDGEEMFDWWISGKSIAVYMADKACTLPLFEDDNVNEITACKKGENDDRIYTRETTEGV